MENFLYKKLEYIYNNLIKQIELSEKLNIKSTELNNVKLYNPCNLSNFDNLHYNNFIREKIGEKPVYNPPLLFKVKQYNIDFNKKMCEYDEKKKLAEEEYINIYKAQRDELYSLDLKEKEEKINFYVSEINNITEELSNINNNLYCIEGLSTSFYTPDTIKALMEISENLYITDLKELLFKYDEFKKHNELLEKINDLERKLNNSITSISNKVEIYKKEFENQVDKIYRKIRDVESEID